MTYKSNKGQTTLDVSVENATLGTVSTPSTNVYSIPVSVTEGTKAITIKFNNITTKTNARLDDITLTAVVEESATELTAPEIEVAGETNAEGAYLDKVELTFVYPANATSMEYKIGSNDAVTVTGTTKIPYSTCGETTIEVTAYQNEESNAESKTIKIIPSAPTLSLAAGFYMEDKTLTITAPEGAMLEGVITCGENKTDVTGASFTTTLEAINGDATTYDLVVYSKKDGIESDYVGGNYVIDPNTIDLRKTGTIDMNSIDDSNFIVNRANMVAVTEYTLPDDNGTQFTFSAVKGGGSNMPFRSADNVTKQYLRLYWTETGGGNILTISSADENITAIEVSTNKTALKINDEQINAIDGVVSKVFADGCSSFTIESTENKQDLYSFTISYGGLEHFEKVADGKALLSMEARKFYQVNVNLEGVKENGGVLYARTAEGSV